MPSLDKSADIPGSPQPYTPPPMPSLTLSDGIPMHIYPFPASLPPTKQAVRSKRRQVKNACTRCQKACKKCDDARPCLRCVKYGVSDECVDSQRKERKKGVKRGPYKKRDGKGREGSNSQHADVSSHRVEAMVNIPPSPLSSPYTQVAYGQHLSTMPRSPDPPLTEESSSYTMLSTYPPPQIFPIYLCQPQHHIPGQAEDNDSEYASCSYFPVAAVPSTNEYQPPYVLPSRSHGTAQVSTPYSYPNPSYSASGSPFKPGSGVINGSDFGGKVG